MKPAGKTKKKTVYDSLRFWTKTPSMVREFPQFLYRSEKGERLGVGWLVPLP